MVRALIVRKLLGREFQREIAEYMGERGIRLVFGFGRRIRLLVLGRRKFDLSGFQTWRIISAASSTNLLPSAACHLVTDYLAFNL